MHGSELDFVPAHGPMPTVEVDINSIPEEFLGYVDLLTQALQPAVSRSPAIRASLYVYQGQSINFGRPTFSVFIGVAGQAKLLESVLTAFRKVAGVQARYSDYIDPDQAVCELHIQNGCVWQPIDAFIWQTERVVS